ncbi:hypothetical protein HX875_16440 [Pseudomonas yamanorum]|nr:hypothetical protein [Pseudomonas yamanorum]NWE41069.1 hypothetical protein [Pseudomonas yamanorum]
MPNSLVASMADKPVCQRLQIDAAGVLDRAADFTTDAAGNLLGHVARAEE